jgi:hypothetical protein
MSVVSYSRPAYPWRALSRNAKRLFAGTCTTTASFERLMLRNVERNIWPQMKTTTRVLETAKSRTCVLYSGVAASIPEAGAIPSTTSANQPNPHCCRSTSTCARTWRCNAPESAFATSSTTAITHPCPIDSTASPPASSSIFRPKGGRQSGESSFAQCFRCLWHSNYRSQLGVSLEIATLASG